MRTKKRILKLFGEHDHWDDNKKHRCDCYEGERMYVSWERFFGVLFAFLGTIAVTCIVFSIIIGLGGWFKSPSEKAADSYRAIEQAKIDQQKEKNFQEMCKSQGMWAYTGATWECRKP